MRSGFFCALAFFGTVASVISPDSAFATPTTYAYKQASSTFPSFHVTGTLSIDGTFSDLPTVDNLSNPGPYNFGNLLGLSLSMDGRSYSLADYTSSNVLGFPLWSISPSEIRFIDAADSTDYLLQFFGSDQISFNADFSFSGNCSITGACKAFGTWVAVTAPEPITVAIFLMGLGGVIALRRRRDMGRRAHGTSLSITL